MSTLSDELLHHLQHLARDLDDSRKVEAPTLNALGERDRIVLCRTVSRILYGFLEAEEDIQQSLLQPRRMSGAALLPGRSPLLHQKRIT